jgi:predicted kinase
LPGSGKSTFLKKYSEYLTSDEIFKIDADEIRAKLPEYKGWNADQTHKESSDIVNKILDNCKKGIPCKYDILYDGTMNKAKNYIPLIEKLKSLGYKTFIIFIEIPTEITRQRVLHRYQQTDRYVPMEVIEEGIKNGLNAFDELKKNVDGYMLIDGITQQIIERKGEQLPQDRVYFNDIKVKNKIEEKEPWQMTFDEFYYFNYRKEDNNLDVKFKKEIIELSKNVSNINKLIGENDIWEWVQELKNQKSEWNKNIQTKPTGLQYIKDLKNQHGMSAEFKKLANKIIEYLNIKNTFYKKGNFNKDVHKKIIEQALSENKPVPQEVLNDYPELVKTDGHPSLQDQIQSEIEALTILLSLADTKAEKEKINTEIEALNILLDIEKFEDGGKISNKLNEDKLKEIIDKIQNKTGLSFSKSHNSNSWYCNEKRIRISDHHSKYTERMKDTFDDDSAIDLVNPDLDMALKVINKKEWFSKLKPGIKLKHIIKSVGPIQFISADEEKEYVEVLKLNENRIVKYDFMKIKIL